MKGTAGSLCILWSKPDRINTPAVHTQLTIESAETTGLGGRLPEEAGWSAYLEQDNTRMWQSVDDTAASVLAGGCAAHRAARVLVCSEVHAVCATNWLIAYIGLSF